MPGTEAIIPKFDYDDSVRVKSTVRYWWESPGCFKPGSGPHVGELASIFSVEIVDTSATWHEFPEGVVYGIEFNDGHDIYVHEDDIETFPEK